LEATRGTGAPPNQDEQPSRDHGITSSTLVPKSPISGGQDTTANEASTDRETVQLEPVPYHEYAAMAQKVNQYRQMVTQCNEQILKLNDNVRQYKRRSAAWKEYAEKVYAKYKGRISADHETTSGSRPITPDSDILLPSLMIKSGQLPAVASFISPKISPKEKPLPPSRLSLHQVSTADGSGNDSRKFETSSLSASKIVEAIRTFAEEDRPQDVHVKNEPLSSPIARSPPTLSLKRAPTLDLDNVDDTTGTPRRRRRMDALLQSRRTVTRKYELDTARGDRSSSVPLGDHTASEYQGEDKYSPPSPLPALNRADSDPIMKVEDDLCNEIVSSKLFQEPASVAATPNQSNALRLVDSNKRILPRTNDGIEVKRRKRNPDNGADRVAFLTEDGHDYNKNKIVGGNSLQTIDNRLTNLLKEPAPARHRLSPLGTPTSTSSERLLEFTATYSTSSMDCKGLVANLETCKQRSPKTAKEGNTKPTSHISTPQIQDKSEKPAASNGSLYHREAQSKRQLVNSTPLRCRPVSELHLSDFKVNPRVNQGYDYLYVESLRSRQQRHPDGVVQTLSAELPLTSSMLPLPTSEIPYGITEADARILKEHMGNAYNVESISNMPTAQQQDLVAQARLRLVAERLERHRMQFQRHQTPPGFWNVNMPTTQELEEERKEAERLERIKIEEMWKEAKREGGLWLFKDEN